MSGRSKRLRVAVLGGGLQGCCVALALAERGASVTLFDRNERLLSRASSANEGKIHLGYVYAGDASLATARMMVEGALAFAPLIRRYLGESAELGLSSPFVYAVHRDGLLRADQFAHHLNAVQEVIAQSAAGRQDDYFGEEIAPARRMTQGETGDIFAGDRVEAVFQTSERAIDALRLAGKLRSRIEDEAGIELRLGWEVSRVADDGAGLSVTVRHDATRRARRSVSTRSSTPCGTGGWRSTRGAARRPTGHGSTG